MQRFGPAELRRWLTRALTRLAVFPLNITGQVTSGSAVIQNPSVTTGFQIGDAITGPGIPPNTTITKIDSVTPTITMSANATANTTLAVITITSGTPLKIHLYQSPPSPHIDPLVSDFQECNFDTYAPILLTDWQGVFNNATGAAENDSENLTWILSANPVTPNNVFGYWLDYGAVGSAPAQVMLWESFPAPVPMQAAGNAVQIAVPLTQPTPGIYNPIP